MKSTILLTDPFTTILLTDPFTTRLDVYDPFPFTLKKIVTGAFVVRFEPAGYQIDTSAQEC